MNHTKHSHFPFLAFAFLASLCVLAILVYIYVAIDRESGAGLAIRQSIEQYNQSQAEDLVFLKEYRASADDWRSLSSFFVHDKDMISFMESIESSGNEFGAKASIASVNADNLKDAPPGTLGKAKLVITLVGSWQGVMGTMKFIENMPFKMSMNGIVLNKQDSRWVAAFNMEIGLIAD